MKCKRGEKRREGKEIEKKWALPGIEPMPGI